MNEAALRDDICRVGRSLFERGYAHSTAGSISAATEDGWLITPTDACLGFLEPARLAKLGPDGQHLSGDAPSKTWVIHHSVYQASADTTERAQGVIHTHSSASVAVSLQSQHPDGLGGEGHLPELLLPITPYFVMKVGHVPLLPYLRPGASEMAQQMAAAIGSYAKQGLALRAIMSARLGPTVWGRTLSASMATLEELEETAKLWLLCNGKASALGAAELSELRSVFGARW